MNTQGLNLQPGDVVAIRATVKQAIAGVGVLVELFSKTDQYEAWIREDLVTERLVEAADADEPPVGSYVEVTNRRAVTQVAVWRRIDTGWELANNDAYGVHSWRELKANSDSWRLLHSGDDD